MGTFLKILKWLFVVFILWIILLLIAVYLSSLNSYKESDFNIPKDFFITKFWDRDPYSEKNWFEDFIKFNELLEKTDLEYFDIESKCIFDKEKMKEWECDKLKDDYIQDLKTKNIKEYLYYIYEAKTDKEKKEIERKIRIIKKVLSTKWNGFSKGINKKDIEKYNNALQLFEEQKEKIIEKKIKKIKNFIAVNKIKYRKINNKEYILPTPEYSWDLWKFVSYRYLIEYSRSIRYVAYRYFEEWKYEQWISVLLNFQWFIDNLINKYDWNLTGSMVLITINNINNEALEYFIDNYELSKDLKDKIEISLRNEIKEWFINNSLKWEYIFYRDNLKKAFSLYDELNAIIDRTTGVSIKEYKDIKSILEILFFVSKDETNLLLKKVFFDLINDNSLVFVNNLCEDKGVSFNFVNLNNYVWRTIICNTWMPVFSLQLEKEQDMHNLRFQILEKSK